MWTARNRHFSQQFFSPDPGNPGGGDGPDDTPPAPPKEEKVTFTPEQQQHLNNLLAAERKDAEEKTALKLKAESDAKAKAEKEQQERDEAEKRGEFDKVRSELEGKVSSTEQERDALASEKDLLQGYFDRQYAAALKELPEAILAFKPADDANVETKTKWLETAQEQASKLAKLQKKPGGNPPNPKAANGDVEIPSAVPKTRMW